MKEKRALLRVYLSEYSFALRKKQNLSQQEMAEKLHTTTRAYGDLERGKYCFSAAPLLFMLLMLEPGDIVALLNEFLKRVYALEDTGAK